MAQTLTYTGQALQTKNTRLGLDAYMPDKSLIEAVNLALLLQKPLLLMGEPGSGKTRLAESVAAEFHQQLWQDHLFRWDIKSTSKARDGFYQYDALARLYDANARDVRAGTIGNYIQFGKFAKAISKTQNEGKPNILLIDEIDKADIDFPNDLLLEIEKKEFYIQENDTTIAKQSNVFIIITSNRERELPPAFLRRCLFQFIEFPSREGLIDIVRAWYPDDAADPLIGKAVDLFMDIRQKIYLQFADNEKKPATSELLEWFNIINTYREASREPQLGDAQLLVLNIIRQYKKGDIDKIDIPLRSVLLKTWETKQIFERATNGQ